MYNITAGIFSVFSNKNSKKRLLNVNHSSEKKENIKMIFPIGKYNNDTKENFIIYNLYINFKYSPSSLIGSIDKLRDLDIKEALKFKNKIINYTKFLKEDIDRINIEETNININYMVSQYRKHNINWFTLYFYILNSNEKNASIEELKKSRVNEKMIRNIESLMLYISFSEKSKEMIKELLINRIEIK